MLKKKSLLETNQYLKDPNQRDKLINRSVLTSSAVEGIHVDLLPDGTSSSGKNEKRSDT